MSSLGIPVAPRCMPLPHDVESGSSYAHGRFGNLSGMDLPTPSISDLISRLSSYITYNTS